jgi:hypothetical protein
MIDFQSSCAIKLKLFKCNFHKAVDFFILYLFIEFLNDLLKNEY